MAQSAKSFTIPFPCWCLVERGSIGVDGIANGAKFVSVPDRVGSSSLALFSDAQHAIQFGKALAASVEARTIIDIEQLSRVLAIVHRSVASVSLNPGPSAGAARAVWSLNIVLARIRALRS
jgi:hypothetical protein